MRKRQLGSIHNQQLRFTLSDHVNGNDIYVDDTVGVSTVGITMGSRRYATFYGLQTVEDLQRRKVGTEHDAYVQKRMGGIEAPRLRFHHMTYLIFTKLLTYRTYGARQVESSVTKIATDIYKYD